MFQLIDSISPAARMGIVITGIAMLMAISFGAAWNWRAAIEAKHQLATLTQSVAAQHKISLALNSHSLALETAIAEQRSKFSQIEQRLKDEISKNDVYRVVVPAGGMQLLRDASAASAGTGKPDGKMR